MRVHVADHPLIAHKLTYLRDKRTDSPTFRRLAEELMTLLAYEATREVRVEPFEIETPVAPTTGIKLSNPKPLIVPILRAGLGMLEGMVRLLPSAEVPILAPGGSMGDAIQFLVDRGASNITAVCLLAAPEGIATLQARLADIDPPVTLVTGSIDEKLNEHGYIVPGLGDAGDRLYGVV